MLPRFYVGPIADGSDTVALPEDEAGHLVRVLRLGPGDPVRVFTGRGEEFDARVASVGRGRATIRIGPRCDAAPEPRIPLTLVQAVLKGDAMDDVVRDATMLGAAAIQPILTARTETSAAALARGHRVPRWQRVAVASAKQCGRAVVPEVRAPIPFDDALARLGGADLPTPALLLTEPRGATAGGTTCGPAPEAATIVVGPEGGWTSDELRAAAGRCRTLTLGGRTLRADAAGLVAMSAVLALWDGY